MKKNRDLTALQKFCVRPETSILETMRVIDAAGVQIALVVDENGRLQGTVTDGDIRRAILRGTVLSGATRTVMNAHPKTATPQETRSQLLELMRETGLRQIPIVTENGELFSMEFGDQLISQKKPNWVVLMVGGLGSRLGALTESTPKPLLNVGTRPLLETIIQNFVSHGFEKFYLSVNYKSEMFRDHFGDGSKLGIEIRYIEEPTRLGTAGSLGLIPTRPEHPFFVMNGDLLTNINFDQMLRFHEESESDATMCVREYDFQVPYGVVRLDQQSITAIDEKPLQKFFVNAGIYLLDPSALEYISSGEVLDMPALFLKMIGKRRKAGAFPIREYWLDIGRVDDLEKAQIEITQVFKRSSGVETP